MASHILETSVLVLNKFFQAVQITSARRAFSMFYQGHVKAVDEEYLTYNFDDWAVLPPNGDMVRTPRLTLRIPRVIQLISYEKIPQFKIRFTRKNIFLRDRYICQFCGNKYDSRNLTIDHVIPRSRGGSNSWINVATCCVPCNNRKGNHTPEQANMRLIRQPKRPHWIPFSRFTRNKHSYPLWKIFTDLAYCTTSHEDD